MALKDGLYKKKEEEKEQQDQTKDADYWKEKALAGGGRSASSGNARGEDYWKNKALSGGTWTPTKKKDQLQQNIYSYNQQRQSDPLYRAMYDQYASYLETMRLASPAVQAEEMTSSKLYNKLPERMQNAIASNVSGTLAKKGMAVDVKAHAEGLRAAGVNGFDYAKAMARYAGTGETGADTMTDEQRAAYDSASENYLAGVSDEQKAANAYMQSTAYAMAQQNRNADAIHSATNPDAPKNSRNYWEAKRSHARRQANAAEQYLKDVIAPLEDERQAAMETVSPWEKQEELDAAYEEYYRLLAEDEKWNSVAEQAEDQLYLFDAIKYTDEAMNQPDFRQKVLEGYMAYCRDVGYEPQQERYALAEWAKGNLDDLPKDVLFAGMEVIPYLHGDDYDKNAAFYYLYATDPNTAQDLLDRKQEAYADKLNSELYEWAGQNTFTRAAAAAANIFFYPAKALEGTVKMLGGGQDARGNSATKTLNALQSGGAAGLEEKGLFNTGLLSGEIDESKPFIGGLSLGDAYGLGISMGQSLMSRGLFGTMGTIALGLSAASDAYDHAKETGASDSEAWATGFTQGLWEALSEYFSLDNLVKMDVNAAWWKNALKQAGIEASEEFCSSLATAISDPIIRGEDSDFNREIRRMITEEGMTYDEACKAASLQFARGLFQDALGGAISGGFMTAGEYAFNGASSWHQWNNDRRSAETQFYGNMAKDGTTDAMSAFLTDNGKHSKTDSTRAIKRTEAAAVKTMSEQFSAAATVAEAQEIYDGVTERYGKNIKKTASRAWAASVSERFGKAKTSEELDAAYNELTGGKKITSKSTDLEKLAAAAYTDRAAKLAAKQKGATAESVREAALKPYKASKVTSDTDAAFIRDDGTEAHAAVVSMNEKGDLVLDDGTTVSAKDAIVSTKTQAALNAVQVIGGKTGALFFEQYLNFAADNPNIDGADYIAALHDAYLQGTSAGAEGRQASFAKRTSNLLTEAAYDYAYHLGVDQADTETREQVEKINRQIKEAGKGATGRIGSVTWASNIDMTTKNAKRALTTGKILAQAVGVDVRLVKGSGQMEGSYHNGVLTLDIDQLQKRPGETVSGAILRVASHELTHFIQDKNAADYKALKNFCFGHILEAHTQEEINRQRAAIIESNKNAGKELSPEAALDEMVANACEQMLLNSDILSELYKQNASLAQKVQIRVSEFFAKLRQNIGNGARSKEAAWMVDAMDELQQKWENALRVAAENQIKLNSVEGIKNTAAEGGEVQYSIATSLKDDLQSVFDNKFDSESSEVLIGETSDFLVNEIGVKPLPNYMPATKAYLAMVTEEKAIKDGFKLKDGDHCHGLEVEGLFDLLSRAENPVAAFASEPSEEDGRFDRLVLVTDKEISGGLGVVIVEVDSIARANKMRVDANKTITAYDKQSAVFSVQKAFDEGRLLYIDKKSGQTYNSGRKGSNSPTAISDATRKLNIQHFWANVNWAKYAKNTKSRVFTSGDTSSTAMAAAFKKAGYEQNSAVLPASALDIGEAEQLTDEDLLWNMRMEDAPEYAQETLQEYKQLAAEKNRLQRKLNAIEADAEKKTGISAMSKRQLQAKIRQLENQVKQAREQTKRTAAKREARLKNIDASAVIHSVADTFANERTLSRYAKAELHQLYSDVLALVDNGQVAAAQELLQKGATQLAGRILGHMMVEDDADVQLYDDVREFMNHQSIRVSPEIMRDIAGPRQEDWNGYRAANGQRIVVTNGDTNIEDLYQQLSEIAPTLFDDQTYNLSDMADRIVSVLSDAYDRSSKTVPVTDAYGYSNAQYNYDMGKLYEAIIEDFKGRATPIAQTVADRIETEMQQKYGIRIGELQAELEQEREQKQKAEKTAAAARNANGDLIMRNSMLDNKLTAKNAEAAAWEKYWSDVNKTLSRYQSRTQHLEAENAALSEKNAQMRQDMRTLREMDVAAEKANESKHKAEVAKLQRQIAGLENRMNNMLTKNELRTVVADERAKAAAEMKNRKDQQMQDYRERKKRTEIMHKIEAVKDMLNKRLMHPTTEKHIPPELSRAVVDFLETVNADAIKVPQAVRSKADGMWKIRIKLGGDTYTVESSTEQGCIEKARTLKLEYQNRTGEAWTKRASLDRIAKLYEDVKNDTEYYSAVYDENVRDMISEVKETVGGRALYELGTAELQDVYTAIRALTTVISNANKAFIENRNMTISEMAMASINFMQSRKGKQYRAAFMDNIKGTAKKAFWNNLKPVYAFRMLGDETLQSLFDNVRRGEDVWAVDIEEAKAFFDDAADQYGYKKWDFKKSYKFEDKTGKTFSLTLQQMLSLYAYSRREQAAEHLAKGGIVFAKDDKILLENGKKKKLAKFSTDDAYPISVNVISEISDTLTEEQKNFAVTMQDYLSNVMGGKGNEVTMQLYGIRRFGEKYYFPLKSSDKYIFDYEQKQNVADPRIKNSGFTKDTVKNASNPIVVQDFMDVWAEHVNRMSQYHALVLPLEDFNRVYGWKHAFVIDEENGVTVNESVRASIGNAWGDAPIGYINQLLKDLNGSVVTDNAAGLVNKGLSLFKKGSVFASLSVVIQQPSAVARAMAYIPEKYFVGKTAEKLSGHKANWEQCKKYAPVAIIKEMGYFDVGMGQSTVDYLKTVKPEGFKEKLGAVFTDSAYRDELLSWAPAMADEVTWTKIWKAAKRMAAATTDLKGEALLQKAGEIFTEAIVNTQVYDSVLSRSALMRSKDTGMKMATAFMAEPTTSANMLIDAVVQGKRGNKKFGALAVKSVAASIFLNSILSAFVYAGRDDDDDETYLEKYLEALVSQLIDGFNPVNMVPFLRDIWSIAEGYDVERSDLSWADDLYRAISNLWSDKLSLTDKLLGISGAVGNITGLPIKNIYRDAKGLTQTIQKFFNGEPQTGAGIKYALLEGVPEIFGGGKVSNAVQLANAAISGDEDQFERVAGRYSSRDEAEERLSTELKERYYAETLPREDAMKLLVQYGGQTEDEAYWTVDKWDEAQKHKGEDDWSYSKYHTLREAIYSGSGVDAAVRELTSHGTNKDDVREQVKTIVTEAYEAGKITESKARSLLQKYWKDDADGIDDAIINSKCYSATGVRYDDLKTAYLDGDMSVTAVKSALQKYGGMTEAEATSRIRYWDFKADHPNSNVKQETIDKYYDKVPDGYGMTLHQAGIPLDVYVDYHERQSKCTGTDADGDGKTDSGSKKAAILQVIDSLPISAAQKDALYYFNGWAASKIYEAPWH